MRLQIFVRLTEYGDQDQPAPFFMDTSTASWKRLKHLFSEFYGDGLAEDVEIWYWDEEDLVIVSSQEELEEACRLAEEGGRFFLQFHVRRVVKGATSSNNQQPEADSSGGTAAVDHIRGKQFQEKKETEVEYPECNMRGNSQPSEQPKAEKRRSISDNTSKQPNGLADAMDNGTEGLDLQEKTQGKRVSRSAGEAASSSSDNAHAQVLVDFMRTFQVPKESMPEAEAMQTKEDEQRIEEFYATMRKMITKAKDVFDEGRTLKKSDEDESADLGRCMLPGALSGANVIAIEMPEMEHQGTESAEPAEIAETGEVTTKSGRDAETGFWMQPQLEAEVKAELRRKLSTMVEKQQASSDRQQQKKHERKASRTDSTHKKKKHRGGESASEESVGESVKKGKSSTSSKPLDVVSEEASSSTPPPHKKHEHKPSKSEGKKKKPSTELLTQEAFMRYMMKFEVQMKKDIAKAVAKKTARSVIKSLPKQGEGSETPASTPVIPSQQTRNVHEDIICDCCDREIVGTRYICGKEDQVIKECAEDQESPAERHVSSNDNCEEGEEDGLDEPPFQDGQEEEYLMMADLERMYDIKAYGVTDNETVSVDQTMGHRILYPVSETVKNATDPGDRLRAFYPTELLRHIICVCYIPEKFMIYGHPGVYHYEKGTSERGTFFESEVQYFKTKETADQPTVFHATELMVHVISQKAFPQAFVVKGTPDPCWHCKSAPEASNYPNTDWTPDFLSYTDWAKPAGDEEEEDDLGPEEDLYPECEDGFIVCSPTEGCGEEQATGERSTSPASSIEVVNLARSSDVCSEPVTSSQETMTVKDDTGVRIHRSTQCQTDDARSLSSLTDESSSDEDFVVIVPDCFDISKPLDPASLQRLSREKLNKGSTLESKAGHRRCELDAFSREIHGLAYDPEFVRRRLQRERAEKSCTPCMASGEEIVHVLPQTEREETSCTPRSQLGIQDENPDDNLHLAEEEPDSSEEILAAERYFRSLGRQRKMEGKRTAVSEEAEEKEENSCAQQDLPWVTEASSNQLEAGAAVDHTPKPSQEVKTSQSPSHSLRSSTQDPKDPDLSDVDQTDLKCSQEFEEEGAAADPNSLDPEQQLNDIVTNTFKKASSGLQQLYKTGKDIFKTLQRGDSYEPEESTYVFKPADYKLPESTWRPSNKEFVMPKSNFKLAEKEFHMPKTTYSGPQTQVPSAGVYCGEFSGPLLRIREMGYFNNERTLALLRKYEGDVEKVVNELIEETDSDWADRRHGNNA